MRSSSVEALPRVVQRQLRLIVDLAAYRRQLVVEVGLQLRQPLAIGQELPRSRHHGAYAARLRHLLFQRAADGVEVHRNLVEVALDSPRQLQPLFRLRVVWHNAQRPFVFARGFGETVARQQTVAIRQQFSRQRQVLDIQQRLLDILPGQYAILLRQVARFAIQARRLLVIASPHQRIGAVVRHASVERDAMVGHDAADQIVFGFLAVFQRRRVGRLLRQEAVGDIDRPLIIARIIGFGQARQQIIGCWRVAGGRLIARGGAADARLWRWRTVWRPLFNGVCRRRSRRRSRSLRRRVGDAVPGEELLHPLPRLRTVRARLLQEVDGVAAAGVQLQRFRQDIDRFVDVIIVAGDLDADPRPPSQTAYRRQVVALTRFAAARRNLGQERIGCCFQGRIPGFGQQVSRFVFEFAAGCRGVPSANAAADRQSPFAIPAFSAFLYRRCERPLADE